MFDGIECQWPLFFTYLVIGACFDDNFDLAKKYMDQLEQIVLRRVYFVCYIRMLYSIIDFFPSMNVMLYSRLSMCS